VRRAGPANGAVLKDTRARSRLREAGGKLALLFAALVLTLSIGEVMVRVTGVAPDVVPVSAGRFRLSANPRLGFEPLPGIDYGGESMDLYAFRGRANALGYRDRDHDLAKPPGVFRIVVLGDSIGAGLYVPEREEIFPALLETLLREKGVDAEVINLSVPGYNTQQEVAALEERGLSYHPDLVLLAYCLNDRALNEGGIMAMLVDRARHPRTVPLSRAGSRWLLHSALYRYARFRLLPSARMAISSDLRRDLGALEQDTTEESLRRLGRLAAENGVRTLVAIFPELTDLGDYRYYGEHRRIAEISSESGLETVDLLETFKYCEAMADGEIGYDRYHPTPAGHRCAAEALAAVIEDRDLPGAGS